MGTGWDEGADGMKMLREGLRKEWKETKSKQRKIFCNSEFFPKQPRARMSKRLTLPYPALNMENPIQRLKIKGNGISSTDTLTVTGPQSQTGGVSGHRLKSS